MKINWTAALITSATFIMIILIMIYPKFFGYIIFPIFILTMFCVSYYFVSSLLESQKRLRELNKKERKKF